MWAHGRGRRLDCIHGLLKEAVSALFRVTSSPKGPWSTRRAGVKEVGRKENREACKNRSVALPRLREIRQSRGLSQRDLAGLAGVSAGTVYRLENQLRGAYPVTTRKLSSALGVSVEELARGRRPA